MKLSVFNWAQVTPGKVYDNETGKLWLRASEHCAVFVEVEGYEVLGGSGLEVRLSVAEPFRWRVETAGTAFVETPQMVTNEPSGEVFTNPDRMPLESGSVLEVTRALRMFKLEHRKVMAQLRLSSQKPVTIGDRSEPVSEPAPQPQEQSVATDAGQTDGV